MTGTRGEWGGKFDDYNRGDYLTPGTGGKPGFAFGLYGSGGDGIGPTTNEVNGSNGRAGVVVIYEYI